MISTRYFDLFSSLYRHSLQDIDAITVFACRRLGTQKGLSYIRKNRHSHLRHACFNDIRHAETSTRLFIARRRLLTYLYFSSAHHRKGTELSAPATYFATVTYQAKPPPLQEEGRTIGHWRRVTPSSTDLITPMATRWRKSYFACVLISITNYFQDILSAASAAD